MILQLHNLPPNVLPPSIFVEPVWKGFPPSHCFAMATVDRRTPETVRCLVYPSTRFARSGQAARPVCLPAVAPNEVRAKAGPLRYRPKVELQTNTSTTCDV